MILDFLQRKCKIRLTIYLENMNEEYVQMNKLQKRRNNKLT